MAETHVAPITACTNDVLLLRTVLIESLHVVASKQLCNAWPARTRARARPSPAHLCVQTSTAPSLDEINWYKIASANKPAYRPMSADVGHWLKAEVQPALYQAGSQQAASR